MEGILKGLGLPCAIIRPILVFGQGDLLLNNMAWALRRFPVFPVYGNGYYHLQPVYVGDLAAQAVEAGSENNSFVADAAGPETFTFEELLRLLAEAVGARVRLVRTPPTVGFGLTKLVGLFLRDVGLTRDEIDGLMAGLLNSGPRLPVQPGWKIGWQTTVAYLGSGTFRNWGATTGGRRDSGTAPQKGASTGKSGKGGRTMNKKKQEEGSYPGPAFPEDFAERLERLIELAGLSREEFAQRLGIEYDRVAEWFEGAELTGGEVWYVARLAWSIPGGLEIIVPEANGGTE